MKFNIFYLTILIVLFSTQACQKENLSTDALLTQDTAQEETDQLQAQNRERACAKIKLTSPYITVGYDDFMTIRNKLINSGISLVNDDCEVVKNLNAANDPSWENKVISSEEYLEINDDTGEITFRIKDLQYMCYGCGPFIPNPLCSYDGKSLKVAQGYNSCILGDFILLAEEDQDISIDLYPLISIRSCRVMSCSIGLGN